MSKTAEFPAAVRPFVALGVDLDCPPGAANATGECPLCGKEKKFSVATADGEAGGLWQCWSCQRKGNTYSFLREFYAVCVNTASDAEYAELAADRGLLEPQTLIDWGVVKNPLTGEWMVPGYGTGGQINQLYRYAPVDGRMRLLALPGLNHHIHRPTEVLNGKGRAVHVAEGPWDGMAWYEVLSRLRPAGGGRMIRTGRREASLLAEADVYAVPGCTVFPDSWGELFAGKVASFLYDSDHPGTDDRGRSRPPAGYEGTRAAVEKLMRTSPPPTELRYLRWGPEGYDPDLPSGTDLRDMLTAAGPTLADRAQAVAALLGRVHPVPPEWGLGRTPAARASGGTAVALIPCTAWKPLLNAWRKALNWMPGLERGLICLLSCAASTNLPGDQLWFMIESPPATGKSTLAEGLATDKKHVKAVSTLTGMTSGYQDDKDATEDFSLLAQCKGKCLIVKDADTIAKSPHRVQLMSQFRDLYDRVIRTSYRNKQSRDYEGHNATVAICGTPTSINDLTDESDLGQRFLTCVIVDEIDAELESTVNQRHGTSLLALMGVGTTATKAGRDGESALIDEAKRMTGGYLNYLFDAVKDLLPSLRPADQEYVDLIDRWAQFVAFARARPDKKHREVVQREMSPRLMGQLIRLAGVAAVVTGQPGITPKVMELVRRVALDTARGDTHKLMTEMAMYGEDGRLESALYPMLGTTKERVIDLLRFLRRIDAVEWWFDKGPSGVAQGKRWRLTTRLAGLYAAVTTPVV